RAGRHGRRPHPRGRLGGVPSAGSGASHARSESGGTWRASSGVRVGSCRTLSSPRSTSRVRVRYAETDKMGVVYYANYLIWFEVGRADRLRAGGWSYRELEVEGVTLPVIDVRCEYRQPARYDDELEIRTAGALLSPVRVRFDYEIIRPADAA